MLIEDSMEAEEEAQLACEEQMDTATILRKSLATGRTKDERKVNLEIQIAKEAEEIDKKESEGDLKDEEDQPRFCCWHSIKQSCHWGSQRCRLSGRLGKKLQEKLHLHCE